MSFTLTKVQSSLTGCASLNTNLKYYRQTNVIVRRDIENIKSNIVRIICGGGSGHEPAHSGYVGEGMLTAAVCGEIFASPSVSNIVNAIVLAAKPGTSVLLIVTNYTGDRLNFGLAGEIAKSKYGYKIETLLVDDDCAIENVRKSVGKRGLAGTILIHKIAGAMAAKGLDLSQIHCFCSQILRKERLATVGFTFKEDRDSVKEIEIGRGIHGEPGILKLDDEPNFEKIIEIIMQKLLKKVPHENNSDRKPAIILMINNLGGTSVFTMSTFSSLFLKQAKSCYNIRIVLEGTFMTSLNQEGISVTILHLVDQDEGEITEYINYPIKIAANVPFRIIRDFSAINDHPEAIIDSEYSLEKMNYDDRLYKIKHSNTEIEACKKILFAVCDKLIISERMLNIMDAEFGDSDTGTLIAAGASGILQALNGDKIDFTYPAIMLLDLSEILQKTMGGSLGAVLCIFLQAAAEAFILDENVQLELRHIYLWLTAIKFGVRAVQKYGLAEVGDRTIIDALQCGVESLEKKIKEDLDITDLMDEFATACERGANNTKEMVPKAGRAAYVFSEGKAFKAEGNDPGAQVIAIISRVSFEAIRLVYRK